jgi:hypothetical protein
MAGTNKGARKFAAQKLKEDPDYFKKLAQKRGKPRGGENSPGSFKRGNQPYAALGGRSGRRTNAKIITDKDRKVAASLDAHKLDYEL